MIDINAIKIMMIKANFLYNRRLYRKFALTRKREIYSFFYFMFVKII